MSAASTKVLNSFPLLTAGSMVYGAMRAYNNFQDKSSPLTYFGIASGIVLSIIA